MTSLPLVHEEIKKTLLTRIGRQWPLGSRLPSVPELARELGTGQKNTLRAVQQLAREGYLQSRPKRGTFVSPELPDAPRATDLAQKRVIIVAHGMADPFLRIIADALTAALAVQGARIEFESVNYMRELNAPRFAEFDARAVLNPDGLVRLTPGQPTVVVSQTNTTIVNASDGYDIISVEEEQGGFMAGRLLREAGCRSACFVGVRHRDTPTVTQPTSAVRLRGFEAGWGEPVPAHLQLWGTSYSESSGAIACSKFHALTPRPDAVFTASDDLAIGFAIGGKALGMEPARDYQLIGFDGQYRARSLPDCPPITSIAIPASDMGRRAAQVLTQRLAQPDKPVERILLGCAIFSGQTVIPRPSISSQENPS